MTPTEIIDCVKSLSVWLFRLIMVLAAIALVYFIFASFDAGAVECAASPEPRGYWSWRYIEPREHTKRWYSGRQVLPKSQLHWPVSQPAAKPQRKKIDALPIHAANEFNEIDAMADRDAFFEAKPILFWPSVMPFAPWDERIAGANFWSTEK